MARRRRRRYPASSSRRPLAPHGGCERHAEALHLQTAPEFGADAAATCPVHVEEWQIGVERAARPATLGQRPLTEKRLTQQPLPQHRSIKTAHEHPVTRRGWGRRSGLEAIEEWLVRRDMSP
jgi:hypothetical protein